MTATPIRDSEAPAHNQQVITACAFIHQQIDGVEKVFLPKRAADRKFLPNVYELPGGHIDFGEDIVEGLKREIEEEFGMHVEVGDPFAAFTYANEIKGSHSIEVIYFARFIEPAEQVHIDTTSHATYGWFAEDELHIICTENKTEDDVEIKAMRKGFALLRGEAPEF